MRFYLTMLAFFNSFIVMGVGINGIHNAIQVHKFGLYVYGVGAAIMGLALFVILTVEYVRTWKYKINRIKEEKISSAEINRSNKVQATKG